MTQQDTEPGRAPSGGEAPREGRTGRVPPVAFPLLAILFGGILVWSFSRVLLAVGKDAAAAIALLMALNILVGSALVAYGRRVRRRPAAMPLLVFGGILVVAAGVVAFGFGDRPPAKLEAAGLPGTSRPARPLTLDAQGLKFLQTKLTAPGGGTVTILFDNKDASVPHNVVVFSGKDASAPQLFRGSPVTGPGTAKYTFTAPPAGTYFFHCEFHPTTMTGTLTIGPASQAAGPPSGANAGATALTVNAKSLAFSPTSLQAHSGGEITIHFDNQDASIPHNIVVFDGNSPSAPALFTGTPVTGPGTATYTFKAPPPGTYYFHCQFHPTTMKGTIVVT